MRTRVGYAGGTTQNPTYRSIGDHAESIQIDFDPSRLWYERLLEIFWTTHNPCRQAWSRQYMSAIFYHDEVQYEAIARTRAKFVARQEQVQTEIVPFTKFWLAEDYHQKYELRSDRSLANELLAIYPDSTDFTASTAAARLNGYLGGFGSKSQLEREIDRLGLSPAGAARLCGAVR